MTKTRPKILEMKFIEGSGLSINTIPPSDLRFFEIINENVQNEPATSYDVELAGQLATIGIAKGKEFKSDGVAHGNWIQTDREKRWFTLLRLYSPLPPFFNKSWRSGEIELVD